MLREFRTCLILFVSLFLITGAGYPLLILLISQLVFPNQANGSLIEDKKPGAHNAILGSLLIAQGFTGDKYFHPRPSAAGSDGYDANGSSGSNLAPSSADFIAAVKERISDLRKNGINTAIPIDMVTSSASGLDPDISLASAKIQSGRVAAARNMSAIQIESLVNKVATPRTFGFLGEPRLNVLAINRALDDIPSNPTSPLTPSSPTP